MELTVADQRVLMFNDQLSADEAMAMAWEKPSMPQPISAP